MVITLPNVQELARGQERIDLSGEDGDVYAPAIYEAEQAILGIQRYITDVKEMKAHAHEWSPSSGFCMVCGADGNA